jgi:hypothetical protein
MQLAADAAAAAAARFHPGSTVEPAMTLSEGRMARGLVYRCSVEAVSSAFHCPLAFCLLTVVLPVLHFLPVCARSLELLYALGALDAAGQLTPDTGGWGTQFSAAAP